VGIQYTDNLAGQDVRSSADSTRTVNVLAVAEGWRSSGITVVQGQEYEITASGKWRAAPFWEYTGPDGIGGPGPSPLAPPIIASLSYTMLIAKVGANGTPFSVGDHFNLRPSQTGLLSFRINDCVNGCGDNDGQVRVTTALVRHDPPAAPRQPAPASVVRHPVAPIPRVQPPKPAQPWR
jgi:hypothetical protein